MEKETSKDDNLNVFQEFEKELDAIVKKIVAQENELARMVLYMTFVDKHPDFIESISNKLYNNHPLVYKELKNILIEKEIDQLNKKQNKQ